MIKTLQKMGIERTYLNIVKAIHDKPTANILSGKKTESIPPKSRNKTRESIIATIIQHSSGSPRYSNQRRKEIKGIQFRKVEVKHSLLADDMILYIENLKDFIRKLLELISEFCKVARYKINTQITCISIY